MNMEEHMITKPIYKPKGPAAEYKTTPKVQPAEGDGEVSDYKELIEELMFLSTNHVPEDMCDDDGMDALEKAATAIENLLSERDALLETLHGECVYKDLRVDEEPCSKCAFSDYPNWQWRGNRR